VWDVDRESARKRMLRALREFTFEGTTTLIPFHIWLLEQQEFIDGGACHDALEAMSEAPTPLGDTPAPAAAEGVEAVELVERSVTAEVNGKRFDVKLFLDPSTLGAGAPAKKKREKRAGSAGGVASGDTVVTPMLGTVFKVPVAVGQTVAVGDVLVIVEAMKMENEITAHQAGVVKELMVAEGDGVTPGQALAKVVADEA
jgi:acetyl-CoA/propionyl-CoA carboxylase biotin carboxyl carrier protein